jgi:hypothetical protein
MCVFGDINTWLMTERQVILEWNLNALKVALGIIEFMVDRRVVLQVQPVGELKNQSAILAKKSLR